MSTLVRMAVALLIVGALAFMIRAQFTAWATAGPSRTTTSLAASALPASGYVDQKGMILLDSSHGYPPVPFLQYATDSGTIMTKQLVFPYARPCAVYAGDLPCVGIDEAEGYPQLPTGQNVRIRGMAKDDRILVYQID